MASVVDELDEEVGSDIPPWKLPALSGPAEGDQIVKKNHFTETKKKEPAVARWTGRTQRLDVPINYWPRYALTIPALVLGPVGSRGNLFERKLPPSSSAQLRQRRVRSGCRRTKPENQN